MYKKGSREDIDNYRPITVISCFSKIIEKIVYDQIVDFCIKNNILSRVQHGFRRGLSTETAALSLIQCLHSNINQRKTTIGIFFDISKAFDSLNPQFLSEKLDHLGFRGVVNNWIISYVQNRKITVRVKDSFSDLMDVSLGTPQGGILGPLIFLLYVNDLPEFMDDGELFMYADDTSIIVSDPDPEAACVRANCVVKKFHTWCRRNNLVLNCNKTVSMAFSYGFNRRSICDYHINLGTARIDFVESAMFLGIRLDNTLNWCSHIDGLCKKINSACHAISSLKNKLPSDELWNVYYALVHSIISYGILCWGQAVERDRVFVLQKRVLRLIYGIKYTETCRIVFRAKNILTLNSIYIQKLLCHVHMHKDTYYKTNMVHSHNTRNRENLACGDFSYIKFKKSPDYIGVKLYNLLPHKYKETASKEAFKKNIRGLLLADCFYTVDEFTQYLKTKTNV